MRGRFRVLGCFAVAAAVAASCGTAPPASLGTTTAKRTVTATPHVTFAPPDAAATAVDAGVTGSGVFWARTADSVFVSSDAGASWLERRLPPEATHAQLVVVDERHVWLLAYEWRFSYAPHSTERFPARAYRTTDTGWQATTISTFGLDDPAFPVRASLAFANETDGFVAFFHTVNNDVASIEVWRTRDGGASWSRTGGTDCPGCTTVTAMDGSTLWVARTTQLSAGLIVTRDAGATWTPVDIEPSLRCARHTDIRFFAGGSGVYACASYCPAGECASSSFYTTSDGGRTWTEAGAVANSDAPSIGGPRDWLVVAFPNYSYGGPSPATAPLPEGTLLRTTNAGATWSEVGAVEQSPGQSPRPAFAGSRGMWLRGAGSSQTLYVTADNGRTWNPAQLHASAPGSPS